jgi:hypothetical protein
MRIMSGGIATDNPKLKNTTVTIAKVGIGGGCGLACG